MKSYALCIGEKSHMSTVYMGMDTVVLASFSLTIDSRFSLTLPSQLRLPLNITSEFLHYVR